MKSIAARLALWYALAATVTLAGLSMVGYFALHSHLIHGIDVLNATEFQQVRVRLGPDFHRLTAEQVAERMRGIMDDSSVLFFVEMRTASGAVLFVSKKLRGQSIADPLPGDTASITVANVGELRVSRFSLPPITVIIATSLTPVGDLMLGYAQISVALVTLMLLVSIAIGFGLSHIALRPIFVIEETANRIRSDNLSERIPLGNIDTELANLGMLLNQMFDRLESSFKQIRRFTAEASHELKTPLSLIRLQTERMLMEGGLSPTQEEAVQVQLEEVTRLNQIIEELLLISRAEADAISLERITQAPEDFLRGFAVDARALAEHRGVHFLLSHQGAGTASFDPKWIRQVLLNLLTNALNVSRAERTITLESELARGLWRVSVIDQGPGVPAGAHDRIFERFVRLGPANQDATGSGLGLAICRSIVELHKGRIWAEPGDAGESGLGMGLRVSFELSTLEASAETPAVAEPSMPHRTAWDPRNLWANLRGANLRGQQQWHSD